MKKEMTEEKGLDPAVADKIGEYVKHKGGFVQPFNDCITQCILSGGPELLALLEANEALSSNKSAKQGLSEMSILFGLLKAYKILNKVSISKFISDLIKINSGPLQRFHSTCLSRVVSTITPASSTKPS